MNVDIADSIFAENEEADEPKCQLMIMLKSCKGLTSQRKMK